MTATDTDKRLARKYDAKLKIAYRGVSSAVVNLIEAVQKGGSVTEAKKRLEEAIEKTIEETLEAVMAPFAAWNKEMEARGIDPDEPFSDPSEEPDETPEDDPSDPDQA